MRYSSRGPASVVLGPTAGMMFDDVPKAISGGVKAVRGKPVSQSERSSAIRLLPYNSFFGFREAVQALAGDAPYMRSPTPNATPVPASASDGM